jgi:DNA-binding MarR family transcriptional regulator
MPTRRRKARTVYLLSQAHFAVRTRVDLSLREYGATSLQYTVLSMLARHPGLSSAELSRRFYRTQQGMGQLLSAMEERGWIARAEDPAHRRILRVTLTPLGADLVGVGDQIMERVERALFSGFGPEQIETFRSMLEAIDASAAGDDAVSAAAQTTRI